MSTAINLSTSDVLSFLPSDTPPSFLDSGSISPNPDYGTFRANNIARFEIPARGYIDPATVRLNFQAFVSSGVVIQGQQGWASAGAITAGGNSVFEFVNAVPTAYQAFVAAGTYSTTAALVAAINSALALAVKKSDGTAGYRTLTVSYSATTGLLTFSDTAGSSTPQQLLMANTSSIGWVLGFAGLAQPTSGQTDFKASPFTGTYVPWLNPNYRFQRNILSCIKKVRTVYAGSEVIEDLPSFGRYQRWLTEMACGNSYDWSDGMILNNTTFKDVRTDVASQITVTPQRFTSCLPIGIFSQEKLIPMRFLADKQLVIEITFNDDAACLISDSGALLNPSVQYTNVELQYDTVEFVPHVEEKIYSEIASKGGYQIKFLSYWADKFTDFKNKETYFPFQTPQIASGRFVLVGLVAPQTFVGDSDCTFSYANPSLWNRLSPYEYPASFVGSAPAALSLTATGYASVTTSNATTSHVIAGNAASQIISYRWDLNKRVIPSRGVRVHENTFTSATTPLGSSAVESYYYAMKTLKRQFQQDGNQLTCYRWGNPYWQIQQSMPANGINQMNCFNRDIMLSNYFGAQAQASSTLQTIASPFFLMACDLTALAAPDKVCGTNLDLTKFFGLRIFFNDRPAWENVAGNVLYAAAFTAFDVCLTILPNCYIEVNQ
jgi:hypothetical protein